MGYGIKAAVPIYPGDLLMSVPMKTVMCRENILKEFPKEQRELIEKIENESHFIALYLMRERAKGESSEWYKYIKMLPKHPKSTLFFTDEDLDELQNPESKKTLSYHREQLISKFRGYELVHYPEAFFYDIPDLVSKYGTVEDFKWAMAIMNARAQTVNEKIYLVPLADFFNVNIDERSELESNAVIAYQQTHLIEGDYFNVYAATAVKRSNQIFLDMGMLPNDAYLENYGISSENNPYDCINAGLPGIVKEENPIYDEQDYIAKKFGFNEKEPTICIRPSEVMRKSVQTFLIIRTMNMTSIDHCKSVLKKYHNHINESTINECFYLPEAGTNRTQALNEFVEYLVGGLRVFATTIEQDKKLLTYKDFTANKKLAIRYRLSQKLAVNRSIEALTHYLQPHNRKMPKMTLQQRIDNFYKWFKEQAPKNDLLVKPKSYSRVRVGVASTERLEDHQTYISVPIKLVIDQKAAQRGQMSDIIETLEKDSKTKDEFHEILFYLLYEKFMNRESLWTPYFDLLPTPKELHIPLLYTDEEIEALEDSLVHDAIVRERGSVENRYYVMKNAIFDIYPQFFPPEVFNLENFKWGTAIINSRSLIWEEKRHLVPMMDLINSHQNMLESNKVIRPVLDLTGDNVYIYANWYFKKGEQVFTDYGMPNHQLFMNYGFSEEINYHDCYFLPLWIEKDDPKYKEKRDIVKKKGHSDEIVEYCINQNSIDTDEDFKFYFSVMFGFNPNDKGDYYNNLHNVLQKRLTDYHTTLGEDQKNLKKEKNRHLKEVIRYKMTEKRIAKEILKYLNKIIDEEEL